MSLGSHIKKRTILISLVSALVAMLAAVSTPGAHAARAVSQSGAPGAAWEPSRPATCYDNILARVKQLTVTGPTVYAAALSNGSRSQYVTWSTDVTDATTLVTAIGSWSAWALATTTTPVRLADMSGSFSYFHPLGVRVHIRWWDPLSQQYTGALDYTINGYYNYDYSPASFSTYSC
jgi:hypothetical protein